MLFGRRTQLVVESVLPDLLHVIPVCDDAMLDGVLESQDATLGLRLIANEMVFPEPISTVVSTWQPRARGTRIYGRGAREKGCFCNVELLVHSHHGAGKLRAPDDGWEDRSRSVVPREAGLGPRTGQASYNFVVWGLDGSRMVLPCTCHYHCPPQAQQPRPTWLSKRAGKEVKLRSRVARGTTEVCFVNHLNKTRHLGRLRTPDL